MLAQSSPSTSPTSHDLMPQATCVLIAASASTSLIPAKAVFQQAPYLKTPSRIGQPASSRFISSPKPASTLLAAPQTINAGGATARDSSPTSVGTAGAGAGRSLLEKMNGRLSDRQRQKKEAWGETYVTEEDSLRNDYSLRYVETGERPQNSLVGTAVDDRFHEYPKLSALLAHKHALLSSPLHSIPPTYLTSSSIPHALASLPTASKFDVIVLSPGPEVSFEELRALDLGRIASAPGFVWLWVGSGVEGGGNSEGGVGLEKGRELISAWGYRRCEDIVWLKTNKIEPEKDLANLDHASTPLFNSSIEHCLMGIRGTVRRSTDPWFVHCNVDTDVIVWEGDAQDLALKPPELHSLVENFCLGTRRLHLYASTRALRRGWLSIGPNFCPFDLASPDAITTPSSSISVPSSMVRPIEGESTSWTPVAYNPVGFANRFGMVSSRSSNPTPRGNLDRFAGSSFGIQQLNMNDALLLDQPKVDVVLPFVEELDALRPKSPPPRNGLASSGGLGRGRGAGLGVTRSSAANLSTSSNGASMGRGRMGPNAAPRTSFVSRSSTDYHPHQHSQQSQYSQYQSQPTYQLYNPSEHPQQHPSFPNNHSSAIIEPQLYLPTDYNVGTPGTLPINQQYYTSSRPHQRFAASAMPIMHYPSQSYHAAHLPITPLYPSHQQHQQAQHQQHHLHQQQQYQQHHQYHQYPMHQSNPYQQPQQHQQYHQNPSIVQHKGHSSVL